MWCEIGIRSGWVGKQLGYEESASRAWWSDGRRSGMPHANRQLIWLIGMISFLLLYGLDLFLNSKSTRNTYDVCVYTYIFEKFVRDTPWKFGFVLHTSRPVMETKLSFMVCAAQNRIFTVCHGQTSPIFLKAPTFWVRGGRTAAELVLCHYEDMWLVWFLARVVLWKFDR